MSLSQQKRTLSVTTPLGKNVLLVRAMRARERLSTLFEYALELISEDTDIAHEDLLGQPVTVRLALADGQERYFHGIVESFAHSGFDGAAAVYSATLVPWTWFLTRTTDCRIFQDQSVPDIVKAILREHGYNDFEEQLSGEYRQWPYCVQYRETDFDFVSRLLEHEGIYYYFKHQADKHTLVLADSHSAHEPIEGYAEIPYYPPDETSLREREHITHWTVRQGVQPGAYAHTDYDFMAPRKDLLAKRANPKAHDLSEHEIYDFPGKYYHNGEGESCARVRLQELHARYERVQAQGNARGLATGALFTLSNYPREDQNREYLILGADYRLQSDLFGSGAETAQQPLFSCTFSALAAKVPYRPARTTPKPIVQGPQSAVVVGPEGEEIWTDQYGRVKIQFHWDRYGKRDEHSSCWVRVSSPWAGKHWGGIAIPRIGQEVIVDFFEGDPDRPIITGRVYNQGQMPPYGLPAHKTRSVMRSDTHKGYGRNELTFEDAQGKENLFVHAQKDQTLKILNNRAKRVKQDEVASIGRHRSVEVGGNQKHEVGHSLNLAVGGTGLRALALLGQLAHLAPQTAGLLKQAGAMAGAQGAGIGAMAMNLANAVLGFFSGGGLTGRAGVIESAGTTKDAGDTLRNNAAAVGEDVGGILSSLPGMMNTVVGSFKSDSIGVAAVEQVGVSKVTNVGATRLVNVGKKSMLITGEEIELITGDSRALMKSDGTIHFWGKDITLCASENIELRAKNSITMKAKKIQEN